MSMSDTELAFIRALSVGGINFSGGLSPLDKRERIRGAILSQNLEQASFEGEETYAQAFERCYRSPLERRIRPREERDLGESLRVLEEDEDDGESEIDEP
jgi:hypothetical protein